MKVYMSPKRVFLTYGILGAITLFAFYSIIGLTWPPTSYHYFMIAVWAVSTAIFVFLALTQSYYVLDGHRLVQHQINKDYVYDCKDIVYINEAYTVKHKILMFYMNTGTVRYLPFDKQGMIYDFVKKNATNLLSEDEFTRQFPNIRL